MSKCLKTAVFLALASLMCGNLYLLHRLVALKLCAKDEIDVLESPSVELKQRRTVMVIDSLLLQINLYVSLTGKPPKSLDSLQAPLDGDGPNWPLDCFGNRLDYVVNDNEMKLVSAGVDGLFGTDDDIVGCLSCDGLSREIKSPIGNWFSESSGCGKFDVL